MTEQVRFSRAPVWQWRHHPGAPCDGARLRDRRAGRPLARAARRHDARGQGRRAQRVDAARRLQPGHLGADRRPGGQLLDAAQPAAAWTTSRHAARRCPAAPAENLFWLGRYTERTEQMVRLARAVLLLIDTDEDAPETPARGAVRAGRAQRPGALGRADAEPGAAPVRARAAGRAGRPGAPAASPSTWARWSAPRRRCASGCRPSSGAWCAPMGAHFLALRADAPGRAAGAGAGAAGAGPAGRAAGGRHRRAERPHDPRPRLALHDGGPAARAADRHVGAAGRLRREPARWARPPAWS